MHTNKNINRLIKTAQGQLEGISKMIENGRECTEISAQLLATQSILKKVNVEILKTQQTKIELKQKPILPEPRRVVSE